METIKTYIENLFQHLPSTVEVNRAKEDLLDMMEDKYNELKAQGKSENEAIGIVISEFGNIDELKEELGIKINLFSGNNLENNSQNNSQDNTQDIKLRKISLDEVKDFIQITKKLGFRIAIGAVLCILSVVPLIVLAGLSDVSSTINTVTKFESFNSVTLINEKVAIAIGLTTLFIFVAIAVALFIISGLQYEKYDYIKKEKFTLDLATSNYVIDLNESFRPEFAIKITIGVILCITSVIPVMLTGLLSDDLNNVLAVLGVGFLLIVVAVAVFLFITAGLKKDCFMQLLQQEEYSPSYKDSEDFVSRIGAIYWPIVTAIYFAWSFVTMDWSRSWIVWPIAGVLFGGIAAICNIFYSSKKENTEKN